MEKNYYEHHIEVQFMEGLLSSSRDWQWLIDYTEDNFNPEIEMKSLGDYPSNYSSIQQPFIHLSRIVDSIGFFEVSIKTPWLIRVYECALVRDNILKLEAAIKNDGFFDVLAVMSYATYLMNCVCEAKYLYNTQLLYTANLHELFDFSPLGELRDEFLDLVGRVSIQGFEEAWETLRNNLFLTTKAIDENYIRQLLDTHFDADFLSFKTVEERPFQTWQESLICDAFRVSYLDRTIEPIFRLRDGAEHPDMSFWSEKMLKMAKESFADQRAICIVETLEYAKYGTQPSLESQRLLVDLCLARAKSCVETNQPVAKLACTAFNVIQDLLEERALSDIAKEKYYKDFGSILSGITDFRSITFMKKHRLPCTKAQEDIFTTKMQSLSKDSFASVKSAQELIQVYKNTQIAKNCDADDIDFSIELFFECAEKMDLITIDLFYWALQFYIEALGNPLVNNERIKQIMITLRRTWQENYYAAALSNMHNFAYEGTVPAEDLEKFNKGFFANPHALAHSLIIQSDEEIAKTLESMSEHAVLLLFNRTTISEYYPEHIHVNFTDEDCPIDSMIAKEILRVYNEKSYRFINAMHEQEILDGFYEHVGRGIEVCTSIIDIKPIYDWIADNIPAPYELLPYPVQQPLLGHVMQLFPILENIVRQIGEVFNIVPFQIDKRKYTRLREVTGIIASLIGDIRKITGTIQGSNEFLFVYYVMYSPNGFNVRNECVHGRRYQNVSGSIRAFRLTVICTYMMLKRLRFLESISNSNLPDSPSEQT